MARGSAHSPSKGRKRLVDTLTSAAASRSMSQSPTSTVPGIFAAARSDTSGPMPHGQPTETTSKSVFAGVAERTIAGSTIRAVRVAQRAGQDRDESRKKARLCASQELGTLNGMSSEPAPDQF